MNSAEKRFEQIEAYLRGQLAPADRAAFEAELAADPALAAEVHRHRLERQALELLVEGDLFAKMQTWDAAAPAVSPEAEAEPPVLSLSDWYANRDAARTVEAPTVQKETKPAERGLWVSFRSIPVAVRAAAAVLVLAVAGWLLLRDRTADLTPTAPIATTTEPTPKPSTPSKKTTPTTRPTPNTTRTQTPPRNQSTPTRKPEPSVAERPKASAPKSNTPTTTPSTPPAATPRNVEPRVYASLSREFYRESDFAAATSAPPPSGSGISALQSQAYNEAVRKFRSGSYGDVSRLLQPLLKVSPNSTGAKELLAHALYRQGRYAQALPYFRQLANSGRGPVAERAQWAVVLTTMQQMPQQQSLFNSTLNRIANQSGHEFNSQARALKQRLGQ
jgi:tetratricopeptide (TPR) repeat protein